MKKNSTIFLSLFCLINIGITNISRAQSKSQTYAWEDEKYPRERVIDMERMVVNVSFEPEKGLVKGSVNHYFTPLRKSVDSIFFDAPKINIKEVWLNGKKAKFKSNDDGVTIYAIPALVWDTKDSIRINYEATPRKGIYFIGWNDAKNLSRKQIWTQGQGVDNRYWVPMWDDLNDKMITETIVKFDSKYKVLSNGTKVMEKDNKDGTKTWHYKMTHPHSSYLMMLGIGDYEIKTAKSKSGVPLNMYYYPEWKNRAESTYKYTAEIMDFFEKEIGVPYAWESYSQIPVQDFMYGAMENTTATVFGDFFCADNRSFNDRNYVAVNAHEMAHQWFGDLVTARCEPHHWLQESFATHYNTMAEREFFGEDHFNWARRNAMNQAIDADSKDNYPVASSKGGSPRYYPKGATVLHMLKNVVGRETFNRAIKSYLLKHKFENVDSNDLLVAFENATGYSLGWFWEEWLYKSGEPNYVVSYNETKNTSGKRSINFTVLQTQELNDFNSLFKMPIVFEVYFKDGSMMQKKEWIEKQYNQVSFIADTDKEISYVLFDPNNEVAKTVQFDKPYDMLIAQATTAASMLDRYDAIVAMRAYPIADKRSAYNTIYLKEKFHVVKSEILSQLVHDDNILSTELIKNALNSNDVEVKKNAIQKIAVISDNLQPIFVKLLADSSYEVILLSLEKLCTQFPEKASIYLEATKGIVGVKNRNVELKWIELSLNGKGDQTLYNQLVNYCSNSYEFQTRNGAMAVLKKMNYFDMNLLENCLDASFSPNTRLANPAMDLIKYFKGQAQYKSIIEDKLESTRWDKVQLEIVNKNLK